MSAALDVGTVTDPHVTRWVKTAHVRVPHTGAIVHLRGLVSTVWYTSCEHLVSRFNHETLRAAERVDDDVTCIGCIVHWNEWATGR